MASESIREELEKIVSSPAFQSSERLRSFLRYTVEQTILGRGDLIKEYSVGTQVFGRSPSFDPRLDTIVRTEARKLRSRLTRYYMTEGKEDPLRIEFRKGSYAPLFRIPAIVEQTTPIPDLGIGPPEPARKDPASIEPEEKRRKFRTVLSLLAVAMVIPLCIASVWVIQSSRRATSLAGSPSIVVLPFLNLSDDKGDKNNDFLSDGLTDELIDSLGRVPGLHVVARTSAFQYKDKIVDIRKIGRDLNVRGAIEGTVRKSGNRLRITAELDDTVNGYRVWSQSYDKELKDALEIQREISHAITSALGVRLSGNGFLHRDGFQASGPVNPEAHQAYLRGRFFWDKLNTKDIRTAIGYFEQAIAIEPDYAEAYEGLAHCYAQIPVFTDTPAPEVIPKIRDAASKALSLDSSLGEAHLDLAMAFDYDFDWDQAEKEFKNGMDLNPGDAVAHRLYSVHLITTGQLNEALKEEKIALDLDPVSPFMAQGMGRSLFFARRYDEAIEQYRKALMLDPNFRLAHWGLGTTYIVNGMYPQGLAELLEASRLSDDSSAAGRLGYAYAVTGNTAAAQKILADLEHSKGGSIRSRDIARIYLGLGDKSRAFEWLGKSVDRKVAYLYLKADPVYDPLRADRRFTELLRRMRLI